MSYIIIGLLTVVLIFTLFLVLKLNRLSNSDVKLNELSQSVERRFLQLNEDLIRFETNVSKSNEALNYRLQEDVNVNFMKVNNNLEHKMDENTKQMFETFTTLHSNFTKFEAGVIASNNELNKRLELEVSNNFIQLNKQLDEKFFHINQNVENKINENFKKTNETFTNIVTRLTKIDEAQKNLDNLSISIVELQNVLSDKTARGSFGEVQLHNILSAVFGESNPKVYQMQYTMSNNSRVDCALFAPQPLGLVGIDSKFPLDNYRKLAVNFNDLESQKKFKMDIKKHIDDIANKYIIAGETTQAILFLPAEAVYSFIHAYFSDIIEYANTRRVWLTSPTTLMSTLTMMQVILTNMERDKYTQLIQVELVKLGEEFSRYQDRFLKFSRSVKALNDDIDKITTTSNKITKRFNTISNVEGIKEVDDETDD